MAKKPHCSMPPNRIIMMRQKGLYGPLFQNTGSACIKSAGNYLAPGMPGSGPVKPKWRAFLPDEITGEMAGIIGGTGDATNAREATINLLNHDELYGQQDALKVGYAGGRLVGSTVYGTDDQGDPLTEMPWAIRFPQSTNRWTYSERLDQWHKAGFRSLVIINDTASPNGSITAERIEVGEEGVENRVFLDHSVLTTTTDAVVHIKRGVGDWVHVMFWDGSSNGVRQWFNLASGTPGGNTVYGSTCYVNFAEMESIGNDWFRCRVNVTTPVMLMEFRLSVSSGDMNINGTLGDYHWFWGVTVGENWTTYIPTTTASVTLDKDDIQLDPSNHDDTQGTYALDVVLPNADVNILGAFLRYESGQLVFDDGVSQTSVSCPHSVAARVGCTWGPDGMRCVANGMWSSTMPYSGSLLTGPFDFFRSAGWPGYFRNVFAYDEQI